MWERLFHQPSDHFFAAVHEMLQNITIWHSQNHPRTDPEDDPEEPDNLILTRMLQLMCEGHFKPNQEVLRVQPMNTVSINLLSDMCSHMRSVFRIPCRASTNSLRAIAELILESIQGPCIGNQEDFALNQDLLETLNSIMRPRILQEDCIEEEEGELTETVLQIFKALLEAQSHPSDVFDRILSVIHLEVLQRIIMPKAEQLVDAEGHPIATPTLDPTQIEALVLVQILKDYKPELDQSIHLPRQIRGMMGRDIVSVEVVWHGKILRRFFHIPRLCGSLSDATKQSIVKTVNRENPESQLHDFMHKAEQTYVELKHQEVLQEYHVAGVFSRTNQERATSVTFAVTVVVNLINMLSIENTNYVETSTNYTQKLPAALSISSIKDYKYGTHNIDLQLGSPEDIVGFLNWMQVLLSSFTLVLFLLVRVPVRIRQKRGELEESKRNYEKQIEEDTRPALISLATTFAYKFPVFSSYMSGFTDATTIYYFWYVLFAILGMQMSPFFSSFLLADLIMKDPMTMNVLKSVYDPINPLSKVFLLTVFVIFIFSFAIFIFHPEDLLDGEENPLPLCSRLDTCFYATFAFGLRLSGGIGDQMGFLKRGLINKEDGGRFLIDVLYFIIVLVILMNIVFGIIIDTFSQKREAEKDREAQTTKYCFICGKESETFERAAELAGGFRRHIKNDHRMWNYLYFYIYIKEQDRDDDDGLEQYVRHCLETNDLSWFPRDKAICLIQSSPDEEQDLAAKQMEEMSAHITELQGNTRELHSKLDRLLDAVNLQSNRLERTNIQPQPQVIQLPTDPRQIASTAEL